jgi:hypothetical protein
MARGRGRREVCGLAVLLPALITGCASDSPRSTAENVSTVQPTELVHLDFEDRAAPVGEIVPSVANHGTVDLGSEVVTYAGGRIIRVDGRDSGYAIRFPEHSGGREAPAAMLLLWSREDPDPLSPAARDFSFGADVLLDAVSSGADSDNGDNVIQRGLYDDTVQYKLQLDGGVPSCRLTGTTGTALVGADEPITRGVWHRLTCERRGDVVSLVVEPLEDAEAVLRSNQSTEPVGSIEVAVTTPLVVGGKVDGEGRVVASATDQFNGAIDNVSFNLLD